jgi:methionyl-tRNA formyltransferase
VELLDDVLPEPSFRPQPEEGATYAEKITAADRELDWSMPAEELSRRVRALSPHIGARAVLEGREVLVWRVDAAGRPVEVQPAGRRRMSYEEFLRGLRV